MFKNRKKAFLVVIVLSLALVLFTTACSSSEPAPAPAPAAPQISEEDVLLQAAIDYFNYLPQNSNLIWVDPAKSDLVANLANYYVIDIRKEADYAAGHIPGSVNIPMATMGEAIPTLPTDKTLVLVCYTGRTGNQTAGVLKMAGFDAVALRGGFEEWTTAELPLEQ